MNRSKAGAKGGKKRVPTKGFGSHSTRAEQYGKLTKKYRTYLKTEGNHHYYRNKKTGEIEVYER